MNWPHWVCLPLLSLKIGSPRPACPGFPRSSSGIMIPLPPSYCGRHPGHRSSRSQITLGRVEGLSQYPNLTRNCIIVPSGSHAQTRKAAHSIVTAWEYPATGGVQPETVAYPPIDLFNDCNYKLGFHINTLLNLTVFQFAPSIKSCP